MALQPVNYANDFLQGFSGFNDIMRQRRLDDATQTQRDTENQRAERTLTMQETSHAADVRLKGLQTQEAEGKLSREQKLQQLIPALAKLDAYDSGADVTLDDDLFKTFKSAQQEFGWIPSDVAKAPAYQKAGTDLYHAAGYLKQILPEIQKNPDSNGMMINYHNIDGLPPEVQDYARQALDGYNTLAEQDATRFGKSFKDDQGNDYTTHFIGGLMLDKTGNVTPLIYATSPDGSYQYVPATTDQANKADSPLFQMPLDVLQLKAAAATKTAIGIQTLAAADPTRADKYLNNLQTGNVVDTNAARKGLLSDVYANLGDKGAELMLTNLQKLDEKKRLSAEGSVLKAEMEASPVLKDPNSSAEDKRLETTKILSKYPDIAANFEKAAKAARELTPEKKAPETVEVGVPGKPGYVQRNAFNQKTGQYDVPVGSPMLKHAPAASTEDKFSAQVRRDISVRLREAQRGYQAAVKKGNPDAVAEAVDFIANLNDDAKANGVTPLPVPTRPMTSDEETSLYDQATSNVKAQRGFVATQLNLDPNKQDVETEFQKLKQQQRPKANRTGVGMVDGGVTVVAPTRSQQAPAPSLSGAPPAGQNNGRIIKDTSTGKRYQSDGASWREVQ